VAAQIAGSVGLAGSANIGENISMFEAIHGSAPRRAGQNLANPSGLLLGAVMMLVHIGQTSVAERVHNAWLRTIEDGVHTYDIFDEGVSKKKVGTKEFAEAVVERLGKRPNTLKAVAYKQEDSAAEVYGETIVMERSDTKKDLVGVDVFLDWLKGSPDDLGNALSKVAPEGLQLVMISNRGVKVWPAGQSETFCCDQWRCRFMSSNKGDVISHKQIVSLLTNVDSAGFDFIKIENLCNFDGQRGYSLDQGE
jgi:isocitrate dehydrogenase